LGGIAGTAGPTGTGRTASIPGTTGIAGTTGTAGTAGTAGIASTAGTAGIADTTSTANTTSTADFGLKPLRAQDVLGIGGGGYLTVRKAPHAFLVPLGAVLADAIGRAALGVLTHGAVLCREAPNTVAVRSYRDRARAGARGSAVAGKVRATGQDQNDQAPKPGQDMNKRTPHAD
jgi:hypothetical protein